MKTWYKIKGQAAGSDSAEVFILDEIGFWGVTAAQFIAEVKALNAKSLTVFIDSPGGDVFAGLAIANWLAAQANVTTHVLGMAASMAGVIAQAGKTRRIAGNGYFMTHDVVGLQIGNADEMREYADFLDRVGGTIAKTFADRTGKEEKTVAKWLDGENWWDANQAKEMNLVDEVMPTVPIQGSYSIARFQSIPKPLAAALNAGQHQPGNRMSKFAQLLGLSAADKTDKTDKTEKPPEPSAKEKFYAAALGAFGIEPEVIATALADNKPDFAATFVKDKIGGLESKLAKVDGAFTAAGLTITAADIAEGKKDLKALVEEKVSKAGARQAAAAGQSSAPTDKTKEGKQDAGDADDLETIRGLIDKEEDPTKRACLARRARKARGIEGF